MKICFAEAHDVADVWGCPDFHAHGLVRMGPALGWPRRLVPLLAIPEEDGSHTLMGQIAGIDGDWRLYRVRTLDGRVYGDPRVVYVGEARSPSGNPWLGHTAMCRRGSDGRIFTFKWCRGTGCHQMWAFSSDDGEHWACCTDQPLLEDHDSNTVFWDDRTQRFLDYQATYLNTEKPFADNIGRHRRRVLFVRTSEDGVHWTPSDSVQGDRLIPEHYLICPDEQDPADLEFYRFIAFRQDGRYVGMQLNYAASPGSANTRHRTTLHAPQLSCEWWLSDDAMHWRRPFRQVFASGAADGLIRHEPMRIDGDLLWVDNGQVYALPRERLFCIRSLANAAFSTPVFPAPSRPVAINAEFGYHDDPARGMTGQGSILVEVLDAHGDVVEGFDREGCVIHELDGAARAGEIRQYGGPALAWRGRTLKDLAGRPIRLRLYFRDARIYDLRWG